MAKRLVKIAKELNVGTTTIVDYLNDNGFKIDNKPTAKISDEMYNELVKEFSKSIALKEQADQLIIGTRPPSKVELDHSIRLGKLAHEINLDSSEIIDFFLKTGYSDIETTTKISINMLEEIKNHFLLPRALKEIESGKLEINLSNNLLKKIPKQLFSNDTIRTLDLSNNALEYLPEEIFNLKKLKKLNITNNNITELSSSITLLKELEELILDGNPIQFPPIEILDKGLSNIKLFFLDSEKEGEEFIYEAKLILVGEPGAGKTTLAKKIEDINYSLDPNEPSTHGIQVNNWKFNFIESDQKEKFYNKDQIEFIANIWDFGGQEIMYSTHNYFLTKRSLYILVADNRKEDTVFYYWLNKLNSLTDRSPVIILLNQKFDYVKDIDYSLKQDFECIKAVHSVNLQDQDSLKPIIEDIKKHLRKLNHIENELIPSSWSKIREKLDIEKGKRDDISLEEYIKLYQTEGITDEEKMFRISDFLHDLGIILHFQHDHRLRNRIILNTGWATEAVYKILFDEKIKKDNLGRFTLSDLRRIWMPPQYPTHKHSELLDLMIKFKLCYQIPDKEIFIVPELLSNDPPKDYFKILKDWNASDDLLMSYEYQYVFMPKGIISHFIVRMNKYIHNDIQWKSGTILNIDGAVAEITTGFNTGKGQRRLKIRIKGIEQKKKNAFIIIRKELFDLHASFSSINYTEMIPCNCDDCLLDDEPYIYELKLLKKLFDNDVPTHNCGKYFKPVYIDTLIKNFIEHDEKNKYKKTNIVISNSKKDQHYVESLKKFLTPKISSGVISVWDESMILGGKNILSIKRKKLQSANFVLLILTPDYIAEKIDELNRINSRHKANKTTMVPIIFRHGDYEDLPLSDLQCLPKNDKPISESNDPDLFYHDLVKEIYKLISI